MARTLTRVATRAGTGRPAGGDRPVRPKAVLTVMCAGMFLVLLDVTAVNVALPSIRSGLHTSLGGQQWVVDGYAVVIAGLLLGGGAIGDRIGHRRVVVTGLAVFGAASAACGVAPGIGALIAARAAQGAGAALLLPGTLAVVADTFPERREQARALGLWAAVSSLALPAGPLLGGLLVSTLGWRPIFLVNVPVVLAAAAAVLLLVPARPGHATGPFDLRGLALTPLVPAGAVFSVISLERSGLGPSAACGAAVALTAALLLWRTERAAAQPVVPLALLRRPAFLGANGAALLMNLTYNGTLFVTTLDLQSVHHESAMLAGASLLPVALPLAVLAPAAGRLTARYGPELPAGAGILLAACGALCMLGIGPASGWTALLPVLVLLGVGGGLMTTAVVAAAVRAVPPDRSGLASGVNNTARQTGTAMGVAVFGAIAGPPEHPARFFTGWHHLAWTACGLWAAALLCIALSTRRRDVPA